MQEVPVFIRLALNPGTASPPSYKMDKAVHGTQIVPDRRRQVLNGLQVREVADIARDVVVRCRELLHSVLKNVHGGHACPCLREGADYRDAGGACRTGDDDRTPREVLAHAPASPSVFTGLLPVIPAVDSITGRIFFSSAS